jgi:hypothetical protein
MLYHVNEIVISYADSLHANTQKPRLVVLFIMDSHGSHGNADVLGLTKERRIELIWLPGPSTHFLQALDDAVSGSFKSMTPI